MTRHLDSGEAVEQVENGIVLRLRVSPNSDMFEVGSLDQWRNQIRVKVASPPEKGKANREILDKLGDILKYDLEIVSGRASRDKRILVRGASREKVEDDLGI